MADTNAQYNRLVWFDIPVAPPTDGDWPTNQR